MKQADRLVGFKGCLAFTIQHNGGHRFLDKKIGLLSAQRNLASGSTRFQVFLSASPNYLFATPRSHHWAREMSPCSERTSKKWYIESMSTMISEVYDALKEAGASEEKARKAAEAVASYVNRFARIEGDLGVVKWMIGFNLAMTVAVLGKVFTA
jgi:hypothetical protein